MTIRSLLGLTLMIAVALAVWPVNWGVSVFLSLSTVILFSFAQLKQACPTKATRILVSISLLFMLYLLSSGPIIGLSRMVFNHRIHTAEYYRFESRLFMAYPHCRVAKEQSGSSETARRYNRLISSYHSCWESSGASARDFSRAFFEILTG